MNKPSFRTALAVLFAFVGACWATLAAAQPLDLNQFQHQPGWQQPGWQAPSWNTPHAWVHPGTRAPLAERLAFCQAFGRAHQRWTPFQSPICRGDCARYNQRLLDEWNAIIQGPLATWARQLEQLAQAVRFAQLGPARQAEAGLNLTAQQIRRRVGALVQEVSHPRIRLLIQPETGVSINCLLDTVEHLDTQTTYLRRQIPRR